MTKRIAPTLDSTVLSNARLDQLAARLRAFFRRGGSSASDAEDLAQDVFVRLTNPAQDDGRQTDAYVFTVARNLQRDNRRRQMVRRKYGRPVDQDICPLVHDEGDALDAERVLISREEAKRMVEGLNELSDRTREIFLLYRLEGRSHRQIAEQLGLSVSAVEKNVAKAMLHLVRKGGWDR